MLLLWAMTWPRTPTKAVITLGPYTINVDTADRVAAELSHAIYLAAHEGDKKNKVGFSLARRNG